MDAAPLTLIDIGFIIVVLASALFALMRGAVMELLSIVGWVAAAMAAFFSWPWIGELVVPLIDAAEVPSDSNLMLARIMGAGVVFLVVLGIMGAINYTIGKRVRQSAFSMADRSLGFAFGIVRALLLMCFAFVLVDAVWPRPNAGENDERPEMLRNARFLPVLEGGADIIRQGLPPELQLQANTGEIPPQELEIGRQPPPGSMDQLLDRQLNPAGTAPATPPTGAAQNGTAPAQRAPNGFVPPSTLPPPAAPPSPGTPAPGTQGYRPSDRSNLDRLMENNE